MATPTVKDPKYINWIRAGIGLLIVKKSISPATMRIIEDFYKAIGGVPTPLPGAIPGAAAAVAAPGCSCTVKDIDFKRKCMKTGCTICNPFVQAILAAHKFPTIYKDNCDPCQWSTDPWEIAKAFMGPGQQKDNHDAEHTDCSNLILMWENCSHFSTHINDPTLLRKVRDSRNAGMHSPKMTLSDAEMKSAFDSMIDLLKDVTLSAEPDIDASSGISELEKVRDHGMSIIPEDELKVWLDDIKSLGKSWEDLKTENEPVATFLKKNPGLLETISQVWPRLQRRVAAVEQGLSHVEHRLHHDEQGLRQVKQRLHHDEHEWHQVDQRVYHVEQGLNHDEQGLLQVGQGLHHVEQRVHHAERGLHHVDQRVYHVEQRLNDEEHESHDMKQILDGVGQTLCHLKQIGEDVAGIQQKMTMEEKGKDQKDSTTLLQELPQDLDESHLTGECSFDQEENNERITQWAPPQGSVMNSELLVKLVTQWWGVMAAEEMPSLNPPDLGDERRSMVRLTDEMGNLTRANHALHHAPLGWLAEATDACSALQILASHTQLKAICLTACCTETCLTAVKALCKAGSSEHQPTPTTLYLGLYWCSQLNVCDVLALLQEAVLTRGVIEPVSLRLGQTLDDLGDSPWTKAACTLLANHLSQIREIEIKLRGFRALEALSRGLTSDAQLQDLIVDCRSDDDEGDDDDDDDDGGHSLPEFRTNIKRLRNITRIWIRFYRDNPMSSEAVSDLQRWGKKHRVTVMFW